MTMAPPSGADDEAVHPFRLQVPQVQLDDLAKRLANTRWPQQVPGTSWEMGTPVGYLRDLVDYWQSGSDWRAAEAELNTFPQFSTVIDGATVRFLHVRSPEPGATPAIMTHGWPGSVVEFLDVIGPLTDPAAHGGDPRDAIHLVLPHIPGFGLSGPTPDAGWDVPRIARAWAKLMRRLGYTRYLAQGGDWGYAITMQLAAIDAEHVLGIHLNTLLTPPPSDPQQAKNLTADDQARLNRVLEASADMSGYAAIQGTRPQTLAYALTDSPVGQLAWIAEKLHDWADPSNLSGPVSRDRLLTNVMLYWLTGTAGSSARLYYERAHRAEPTSTPRPSTPVGVAAFGGDVAKPVRRLAEQQLTITHWSELPVGGHFAALEQPELFVQDLQAFLRQHPPALHS